MLLYGNLCCPYNNNCFFGSVTRNITRGLNTDKASKIEKKNSYKNVKNLAKKN